MSDSRENITTQSAGDEQVLDCMLTVPNVISTIRLIMAPIALVVFLSGNEVAGAILFGIVAATDCLDGQIARRTNTVSRLGRLLDPTVDRVLMVCAVVGLLVVGRLPLWIVVLVIARDILLVVGGSFLLRRYSIRIPVIYPGKVATTFLFVGMAGLMLNMPQLAGLGLCDIAWLPGFNGEACSWGIWAIYIGMCIGLFTTVYYVRKGFSELKSALGR